MKTYCIIITKNRKKKKLVFETNVKKNATQRFNTLIRNNKVLFPVKYINNKNPLSVDFEMLLLKRRTSDLEKSVVIRDFMGRTKEPHFNNDEWVLIKHRPYSYEETFKIHGLKDRLTFLDIISKILNPTLNKFPKDTGHLYRFQNKICLEVGGEIKLLITKNKSDCIRLYDKIKEIYLRKKKLNILFSGEVPKDKRSSLYSRISILLKIDRDYLWRGMTR